ncbi:MAG: cob(I)yrinic acid a,c-diamide adenosyltransferase [Deltaproteobacteria bacterium]|nr:cob(I)yrinic acid a,c-diamide adenosyltransferase [Deltaproteobacteria bacterium]
MNIHLLERGLIQVYTGNGKGKTTAALGLALRAVGRKLRVCMIQFVKGCEPCGEHLAAEMLAPYLTIVQTGHKGWLGRKKPGPEVTACARKAFEMAQKAVSGEEYDLVILDEINTAASYGLVTVEELLQLMKEKDTHVELVLTGRNAKPEIIAAADLVTEMREIKHYFKAGVPARIGIEK